MNVLLVLLFTILAIYLVFKVIAFLSISVLSLIFVSLIYIMLTAFNILNLDADYLIWIMLTISFVFIDKHRLQR